MADLIQRALKAKRESKYIEFKESFDPSSSQHWCEIIKDIIAMANSGGGIIIFGVNNSGIPTGIDVNPLLSLDPADITNKIFKYTAIHFSEIEVLENIKSGKKIVSFLIYPVSTPIVFAKPGTYANGSGKQKTAFSVGTVYFRHGAKSEPGSTDDIRMAIERQLDAIRKSWLKGVRKVVQAPREAQIVALLPKAGKGSTTKTAPFRIVDDPNAPAVRLTRNREEASGIFVHEELSDGIFDEINNVLDANTVLAKGKKQFFFGQPLYYRIYAERQHVRRNPQNMKLLAYTALLKFYCPGLYWLLYLPPKFCAEIVAHIFRNPKMPHVHSLIRLAILLGPGFSDWLLGKWEQKWYNHPQPPSFFWTFKKMRDRSDENDRRLIALRMQPTSQLSILKGDPPIAITDFLKQPTTAAAYLSRSCMLVFEGQKEQRSVARQLDYLAYGKEIEKRADKITQAILDEIGSEEAGYELDN